MFGEPWPGLLCTSPPPTNHYHSWIHNALCWPGLTPSLPCLLWIPNHTPCSPCINLLTMAHVHLSFIPPSCPILTWHSPFLPMPTLHFFLLGIKGVAGIETFGEPHIVVMMTSLILYCPKGLGSHELLCPPPPTTPLLGSPIMPYADLAAFPFTPYAYREFPITPHVHLALFHSS